MKQTKQQTHCLFFSTKFDHWFSCKQLSFWPILLHLDFMHGLHFSRLLLGQWWCMMGSSSIQSLISGSLISGRICFWFGVDQLGEAFVVVPLPNPQGAVKLKRISVISISLKKEKRMVSSKLILISTSSIRITLLSLSKYNGKLTWSLIVTPVCCKMSV